MVGGWEVAGFTGPTLQGSENSISEQVCQICRGQMLAEQGVSHWVILFIQQTLELVRSSSTRDSLGG